jgi:hypothetical protein
MLFVTIGLTGDPIGCYSSPIDAHEMAKRSVGATMTQCRLNSEVAREEHSHDYILTVDGACHSVYECASSFVYNNTIPIFPDEYTFVLGLSRASERASLARLSRSDTAMS